MITQHDWVKVSFLEDRVPGTVVATLRLTLLLICQKYTFKLYKCQGTTYQEVEVK